MNRGFYVIALVFTLVTSLPFNSFAEEHDAATNSDSIPVADTIPVTDEAPSPVTSDMISTKSLGMVTGSPTGTYYRFGHDIKEAIIADNVEIDIKQSKGSITNIKRIGSNENAAFGIVQSDVLGFLSRSTKPESRKLAENLRMVFPFYQEEVHIIANKNIKNFKDLDKRSVAVGPTGSGSWLTAMNMFSITKIRPSKLRRLSPEEGMKSVLTGEADAMIFVAGKPVTLFQTLDELANNPKYTEIVKRVHFLPIEDEKILSEYNPSTITSNDYSIVTEDVPTVAVTAVLVSYDFSNADSNYARARCNDIKQFSAALNNQIASLKVKGHPKWKEVNLDAEVGIWMRDKCSSMASTSAELENELLDELEIQW
jgi:TRAP transporter TAXI family solute receptor